MFCIYLNIFFLVFFLHFYCLLNFLFVCIISTCASVFDVLLITVIKKNRKKNKIFLLYLRKECAFMLLVSPTIFCFFFFCIYISVKCEQNTLSYILRVLLQINVQVNEWMNEWKLYVAKRRHFRFHFYVCLWNTNKLKKKKYEIIKN